MPFWVVKPVDFIFAGKVRIPSEAVGVSQPPHPTIFGSVTHKHCVKDQTQAVGPEGSRIIYGYM